MQLIHDYIKAILIRNFNLVFVHVNLFMVDLLLFFHFFDTRFRKIHFNGKGLDDKLNPNSFFFLFRK